MTLHTTDTDTGEFVVRARREIVFIESDVPDLATLLQGIGAGKEVVMLDASADGLRQIADALAGRSQVDALHIVSHGEAGAARLGSLMLDARSLEAQHATLQEIGRSMSAGADILLYGCDIGAGAGFVDQLAIATGADVAASSGLTGATDLGGDWELEVSSGAVETASVIDAGTAALYRDVLAIPSVTVGFDNFSNFANDGDPMDTSQNVVYQVNGSAAYQLVIDGAVTGTTAYSGSSAVFAAPYMNEDSVTFSFAAGQVFTPGAIAISNYGVNTQTLQIKGFNAANQQVGGTVTYTLQDNFADGDYTAETINLPGMTAITRLVVTATTQGGKIEYLMFDSVSMTNIEPPPPAVTSVSSSTANGSYNAGDTVTVTVSFDQAVTVNTGGGVPTLLLETGSVDRQATYTGGSGTATLSFTYTVQAGDTSADLSYTSTGALALNGGTIAASAGGSGANLLLPLPGALGSLNVNKAIVIDTAAPTLAITSNRASLKAGDTATITFTFSEDPGASFSWNGSAGDIVVSGGTLGALSGSGLTRTATFTPTAGANGGSASITVASGAYTDTAGNAGGAGSSPSISFDTLAPTLAISSDRAMLKTGESATITFTFSEDPGASFTLADVAVSGGSLGALAGSGLTRTATFIPAANTDGGVASITVASSSYADTAGNTGGAGSTPALSFDTRAPNAPAAPDLAAGSDSGASASDNLTSTATPTFGGAAGSAEAGATIRIYDGAILVATTVAQGDGSWSVASSALAQGAHTITATATDAAGNTGAASAGLAVTVDFTPPPVPAAPDLATASDSGSQDADDLTRIDTPIIGGAAGSAQAGATLRLFGSDGVTVLATTTVAGDGSWSVATSTLAEGAHTITAKTVDAAGNESAASGALALTVDRTAPATTAAGAVFSDDTGASASDMVTSAATQTISGTLGANLAAGERVEVSLDNGASWTVASASVGANTWSAAATLAASNTLQVRVVDAAGNPGPAYAQAYVLDTSAPAAASAPDLAAASDSGASNSDDITGDTTPTFSGTAEAGATVTLYDGASVIGSAVATGGAWSITSSTLGQGGHSITAVATDLAGNEGAASAALLVQVDTSAPTTGASTVAFSADTGASASDLVTMTAAQTISGTLSANLAANERVEVSLDNGASWTTATAAVGSNAWSLPATLAAGANTLQVRVLNAVDNSGPVLSRNYLLDNAAPALTIGASASLLKAGESATITFSFSEDPGASFNDADIGVSGGTLGSISGSGLTRTATFTPTAGANGGSASISVAAGAYADAAGNLGGAGAALPIAYDTQAPAAPSTPVLAAASDSGVSAGDRITADTTPAFTGTAEPGATVILYGSDGSEIGSAVAGGGAWSITASSALADGEHSITARVRDAAGNLGAASAAQTVLIDTVAPVLAIGSNLAQLKAGETAIITFTFSEDPGASFGADDITVSGGTLGALSGAGTVRSAIFTPDAGVNDGLALIQVGAGAYADAAGNAGGAGAPPVLTFDTQAPAAPAVPRLAAASDTGAAGDGITGRTSPVIEGDAAPHSLVRLYDGATLAGSASADALGKWSITSALGYGTHSLTAVQLDAAGNLSAPSAAFALRIDAPPEPPAPLVDGVPVTTLPAVLPGGVSGTTVTVPVVTGSRTETSGSPDVADIPLATAGGANLLVAQLAPGYGLSGSGASVANADALAFLLASIQAATPAHAPLDQGHLTGNGQSFLAGLAPSASLLVQTVTPVSGAAPDGVLTLSAPAARPGQSVALVIDAGGMAGGGTIELQHIDFAAVIGSADVVARSGNPVLTGDAASQHFSVHASGSGGVFAGGGNDTLSFGLEPAGQGGQAPAHDPTTLHGGLGTDSASFAGARSEFDIVWHHGYVVVSSKAAPQEQAIVVNAERLQFSDTSVAVENGAGLENLAGMYRSVLGRQADLGGFEFWASAHDRGASWGAIALGMIDSAEHAAGQGGFNGNAAHDIGLLYTALFDRAADAEGLAYWQGAMERGATLEQVASAFVEAAEMVGQRRADVDWDFTV